MTQEPTGKTLEENIMSPIETGKVKMRPRWYFVFLATIYLMVILLGILSLLYLVSFIIFILNLNTVWFLPSFGLRGTYEFFISLPWLLIILAILFIIILESLAKKYPFVYRRPLIYSTIGIIVFAIAGGLVTFPFHNQLYKQARLNRLPVAGGLYRYYGMPRSRSVLTGEITELDRNGYRLQGPRGESVAVTIIPSTSFSLETDFAVGDKVIVFGKFEDETMKAWGMRKVINQAPPFLKQNYH